MDTGFIMDAAAQRIGRMEARLLLQHVTGLTASQLIAHPEQPWEADVLTRYTSLVARRAQGIPVAYLMGQREFYGREFRVAPGVLIPRPETELLVERALAKVAGIHAPRILDLGCGSGCIAITLALELEQEHCNPCVHAVDVSADALAIARENAARLGAKITCIASNWFNELANNYESEHYHLIVSNPPYIAENDPHLYQGDLPHEPLQALASGQDGLDALRHLIARAPDYLQPGGRLLLEHGYDQAEAVRELLQKGGYTGIEQHRDLAGILRVSGGDCPPPPRLSP